MHSRRLRNVLPWTSVVILGALAAGGGWLGAAEQAPSSAVAQTVFTFGRNERLTRFAGYYDVGSGPFAQISAEWTVPRVLQGSAPGGASEWVGLLSTADGAFIQLGTKEIVDDSEDATTSYRAVWSDTRLDFKAQPIMVVLPGDVVQATMSRVPRGWRLRFKDLTQARSVDFVVRFGAHTHFTTAEWLEENVSGPFSTGPFLRLSPFTYKELRLNDEVVPLAGTKLEPAILQAPNGVDVVPTVVHDDSFTNKEPSGRTASYVGAVGSFSNAVESFLADWAQAAQASDPVLFPTPALTPQTTSVIAKLVARESSTEAVAATGQLIHAVRQLRAHFSRSRFPTKDRKAVSELLHDATAAISSVEAAVASYQQSSSWTVQELHDVIARSVGVEGQLQLLVGLSA